MLIDSHCHIYSEQFDADRDEVISRATDQGIEKIYMPNIDRTSIDVMLEVEHRQGETCIPMMGLHPCSVGKHFEKELYVVEEWLKKRRFVAIGEIGTDLYWDRTWWPQQQEALKIQLDWAADMRYPVVLHCRESIDETIEIVRPYAERGLRGVFHCFTGTEEQAKEITDMHFHLGIGGVATFKNGGLENVLTRLPLEVFVLETDSPYLAPTPHRGKRNEPAYVRLVAERIAAIREIPLEEVIQTTSDSTTRLYDGLR